MAARNAAPWLNGIIEGLPDHMPLLAEMRKNLRLIRNHMLN